MSADDVEGPVKARPEVPSAMADEPIATQGPGTAVAYTAAAELLSDAANKLEALTERAMLCEAEMEALKDWAAATEAEALTNCATL